MERKEDKVPHVVIVGAGLVGVTSAYTLATMAAEHGKKVNVTVLERNRAIALETSFANAGRFCTTSLQNGAPYSGSTMLKALLPNSLRNIFNNPAVDPNLPYTHHIQSRMSPNLAVFGCLGLYVQYFPGLYDRVRSAHRQLATLSNRTTLHAMNTLSVGNETLSEFAKRAPGTLWMYRDAVGLARGIEKSNNAMTHVGMQSQVLDRRALCLQYPWLQNWKSVPNGMAVSGAVNALEDFSVDARRFTEAMYDTATQLPVNPVKFEFNQQVKKLVYDNTKEEQKGVKGVELVDGTVIECDKVVLACAHWTGKLIPGGPFRQSIAGMHGFSVDLHGCKVNGRGDGVPDVAFADYSTGELNFQFTPRVDGETPAKGRRSVRLVGFCDFMGGDADDWRRNSSIDDGSRGEGLTNSIPSKYNPIVGARRWKSSQGVVEDPGNVLTETMQWLLPGITWESRDLTWTGIRPMTPDNLPYVGEDDRCPGLFLSFGHGSQGWTTSLSTAHLLSKQILDLPFDDRGQRELAECMHPNRFDNWFTSIASAIFK